MSPRFPGGDRSEETIERLQHWSGFSDNAFAESYSIIDTLASNSSTADCLCEECTIESEVESKTMPLDIVSACYAATVAAGGVFGYLKAGSVPSLVAGLFFGSVLGAGTYMMYKNPNNYQLTLGTSTALLGLMGYRFFNSGKFMPAGLIMALSGGMVLRILFQLVTKTEKYEK